MHSVCQLDGLEVLTVFTRAFGSEHASLLWLMVAVLSDPMHSADGKMLLVRLLPGTVSGQV